MSKLIDYLNKNKVGQLATLKDGKPELRPFTFAYEKEGVFYFITSNDKKVFKELKEKGVAGFSSMGGDYKYVRLSGEATFIDDLELKTEVLNNTPTGLQHYKTADNPIMECFYIHNGAAVLNTAFGEIIEEMEI
jgi:uncharacterized pyridoxamine 5'-phosphate oxidase family protein